MRTYAFESMHSWATHQLLYSCTITTLRVFVVVAPHSRLTFRAEAFFLRINLNAGVFKVVIFILFFLHFKICVKSRESKHTPACCSASILFFVKQHPWVAVRSSCSSVGIGDSVSVIVSVFVSVSAYVCICACAVQAYASALTQIRTHARTPVQRLISPRVHPPIGCQMNHCSAISQTILCK